MPCPSLRHSGLRGLLDDERGSVAMIVGVTIVMLTLLSGLAIDTGRIFLAQQRLSHALDAAALGIGTSANGYTGSENECGNTYLTSTATKLINANYNPSLGADINVTVCQNSGATGLAVSSQVAVPTIFMRILGFNTVTTMANAQISAGTGGLEVVMVLDNTGSMASPPTNGGSCTKTANAAANTAFACLNNAATLLVNTLWGVGSATTWESSAPAAKNTLYFGVVPFTDVVNVLNQETTTINGTTFHPNTILGATDYNLTVGQVVNTTAVALTTTGALPLCAYNGTWTPAGDDYVNPMDLIHLAQDLCQQYVSATINATTGLESFSTNPSSIYLADNLNTSSKNAWKGCVEERASYKDTSTEPYSDLNMGTDPNTGSAYTYASDTSTTTYAYPDISGTAYDFGIDYTSLPASTTSSTGAMVAPTTQANTELLWHIYREYRNPFYHAQSDLPNSTTLTSRYYYNPTTAPLTAIYSTSTTSGKTTTTTYYQLTNYYVPNPFYVLQACASTYKYASTAAPTCTPATGSSASITYSFSTAASTAALSKTYTLQTTKPTGTPPTSFPVSNASHNYYWSGTVLSTTSTIASVTSAPNANSNISCPDGNVQALSNDYATVETSITSMTAAGYTDQEPGLAWGARVLGGYDGTNYHPPFLQAQAIGSNMTKVVVFVTDGLANLDLKDNNTVEYNAYSSEANSTDPWQIAGTGLTTGTVVANADPPLAALEYGSGPVNKGLSVPPATSADTFSGTCAYSNTAVEGGDTDAPQTDCRINAVCAKLRANNYHIFTVFLQDSSQSDAGNGAVTMTDCTADGSGNIAPGQAYNATDSSSLSTAFSNIANQLSSLYLSR